MPTNTQESDAPVDIEVDETAENLRELEINYVSTDEIVPNSYNPNRQNEREFRLLLKSIREDGFTQPIVVLPRGKGEPEVEALTGDLHPGEDFDPEDHDMHVIVDGEHRWRAARKLGLEQIPVVAVDMEEAEARVSTLRHNRASGSEDVDLAADVMQDLQDLGALDLAQDSLMMDDTEINRLIEDVSVDDELADEEFSTAWEPSENEQRGEELVEGDGKRTTPEGDESSASEDATEALRDRERKMQEAKDEEERQMAEEDTKVEKFEFVFTDEQAEVVEQVLGDRKADNLLRLCVDAYEGEIDTEGWFEDD